MKFYFLSMLFSLLTSFAFAQSLSEEETKLYKLIMEYRKQNNLPFIPLSKSLTIVAQTHVADLQTNHPDNETCNIHSWSANGKWTSCCYTPDHKQASCMWAKPRELTSYKGNGFEIALIYNDIHGKGLPITAAHALSSWKKSPGHNALIVNEDNWKKANWKAIGICLGEGYSVIWFGMEPDL